jgi:hypothetical protein
MDQWGDPLKKVPEWQNYLGYALFTSCMGYFVYRVGSSKYEDSKKERVEQETRLARARKAAALEMAKANQQGR